MAQRNIRFEVDDRSLREQIVFGLAQSGYKIWVEKVERENEYGNERIGCDIVVEINDTE